MLHLWLGTEDVQEAKLVMFIMTTMTFELIMCQMHVTKYWSLDLKLR